MASRKSTLIIKRIISEEVSDPQTVQKVEQLFLTGPGKPRNKGKRGFHPQRTPDFWAATAKVAAKVATELKDAMSGDVAYIVTVTGPGAGRISLASSALATRRILERTHRLATPQELKDWRAQKGAAA
jgi:hypothetical protein